MRNGINLSAAADALETRALLARVGLSMEHLTGLPIHQRRVSRPIWHLESEWGERL